MSLTAGQIAHQLHNHEVEIAQLKDYLANYPRSRRGGRPRGQYANNVPTSV
jgi:hypothetical protein